MSRFFVGQKVRVVRDLLGFTPYTLGCESVVAMFDTRDQRAATKPWNIGLRDFPGIWFHPEELEPVLAGHQPCESEFKESLDKLLEGLPA